MASHHHGINTLAAAFVAWAILVTSPVYAGVQEFTDKDEWIDAVGKFTTIDFTGFEEGTIITDQYADLGVFFTDGDDEIDFSADRYPNDNWGLNGNFGGITLAFDSPQSWFGADYAFGLGIWFFRDDELVLVASFDGNGGGNFGGIISDEPFDSLFLTGHPAGCCPHIDDLHFGPPGPGKCPWDLNGNGSVGASDLLALLASWGPCKGCPADFDGNGNVGASDLLALLANWGPCP